MSSPRLSIHGLSKSYGSVRAVREVSFDVAGGEIFGLLGPNGAGKTTTLECILGLRRPEAGQIFLNNIDVLARPREAKRLFGAQIQGASLQDKITPHEALRLYASFYDRALPGDELLARFALQNKADAPFVSLSTGQRQRLFLALAFVNNPQVLVLDEPTAGLDPRARRSLHDAIRQAREEKRAVILSTHLLDEAERLCDRIAILDAGRIVAIGSPAELIARASTLPRVLVRAARPLPSDAFAAVSEISSARVQGHTAELTVKDVNSTIAAVAAALAALQIELVSIETQRASLEDAYLALTGYAYSQSGDADEESA